MTKEIKDAYQSGYNDALAAADAFICEDNGLVKNVRVYGLRNSIRRAKFPMATDVNNINYDLTNGIRSLAQSGQGEGHDQWLTGVIVQFDLSFSNKAWVEAERYHFLDFVSSQSTMHRITKFDIESAYNAHVDERVINVMKELVKEYNGEVDRFNSIENNDEKKLLADKLKEMYLNILYSNPAGFVITAGMTTNYRQLKTIYKQRRNHRLPEWRAFCSWIETLPMSYLITGANAT